MDVVRDTTSTPGEMQVSRPTQGTLQGRLSGEWRLREMVPSATNLEEQINAEPPVRRLTFDTWVRERPRASVLHIVKPCPFDYTSLSRLRYA